MSSAGAGNPYQGDPISNAIGVDESSLGASEGGRGDGGPAVTIRRKRPRRKGDRFAIMRTAGVGDLPALDKPRRGSKFADPEDVLQEEVNETLDRAGQFHFRIPASVYRKAQDKSISGWPDNPMITKLMPGLALLGPLELKRQGETLNDAQVEKQALMGTVEADNWPAAYGYIQWFWKATEVIRCWLRDNPIPEYTPSKD